MAVEWLLLTSLSVSSAAQVREIVEAYCQRFMTEVFFRVPKSGCRIEDKRFERAHSHLSQLGQHEPQRDGAEVFSPEEWQSAWAVIERSEPMPTRAPSVGEIIKLVGKLGGWIQRGGKSTSPPGAQALWQGLQSLHDISTT